MNSVRELIQSFVRRINNLAATIGRYGSYRPVDDSKSGINIDGKIYNVVVSLSGCYWYLDEDGKKQAVAKIPETTPWEWVNIAEKDSRDLRACYQTPEGRVEIYSWVLFNDQIGELKEVHYVTNSSDPGYPIGLKLDSIPADWFMVDCDFTDAEERHIYHINTCYSTKTGKVQLKGYQIVDSFEKVYETEVYVINSTDIEYPVDSLLNAIPSEFKMIDCDFTDKTQRHAIHVNKCFKTDNGKIQLSGYQIVDSFEDIYEMELAVINSSDPDFEVGDILNEISAAWIEYDCDFASGTQRHMNQISACYESAEGKVYVEGQEIVDNKMGVELFKVVVLESNIAEYPIGTEWNEIPAGFNKISCNCNCFHS